jgi:hypothetical protein
LFWKSSEGIKERVAIVTLIGNIFQVMLVKEENEGRSFGT